VRAGLCAAGLVLLTAGCSSGSNGVSVAVPTPSSSAAALSCSHLDASLPHTVQGQASRTTSPDSPLTAAWGDPAITLSCGVATPPALTPTSQLVVVNGVSWLPQQLTHGYRFTTVRRVANVQVDVPDAYSPEAGALADLAQPIKQTIPRSAKP